VVTCIALLIPCLVYDSHNLFENDLTIMHPRPNQALSTQRRIDTLFPGAADPLLVYLEAPTPQELVVLAHKVDERIDLLASQTDYILGSFGLASLLPNPDAHQQKQRVIESFDVHQIIHDFNEAVDDSPFNSKAFDPYRNFLRQLFSPQQIQLQTLMPFAGITDSILPKAQNNRVALPTEAVTTIFTARALGRRSMRNTTIHAIRAALADLKGVTLTGITVIGYDTENTIRSELGRLFTLAASVVITWLLIQFRSIRAVMLALLPAAFGMIVLLACMIVFEIKLNTFNLIALPLLVGIGVDDGIFLTMLSRQAKQRGHSRKEMVNVLSTSCHAIGMTSLTTFLTFGTLAFTSTPAIQSLGLLLTIGVIASWIGAMWILTPLLAGGEK